MVNPGTRVSTDWNEYLQALNRGDVGQPYQGDNWVDSLGNFLVGKDEQISKISRFEPDVRQMFANIRQQGQADLKRDVTGDYDRSIRQQYEKYTFPSIMSRLSSAGVMSSADKNRLLAQSSAQFEMGLGADKQRMQQEHEAQALRKLQFASPEEYAIKYQPENEGFMQKLPGLIASVLAAYYTGKPLNPFGGDNGQSGQAELLPQSRFGNSQGWQTGFQTPSLYGNASVANVNALFSKLLEERKPY